jgi:hypothetical protein
MSLDPGGAVTSHSAIPSQPARNGPPAVTGQAAGSVAGLALGEPAVTCAGVTYRFGGGGALRHPRRRADA